MITAAAHAPSPLWYATRGAGATTLVLLTLSVAIGIAEVRRWRPAGAWLFVVAGLHRTVSLLALVLLAVHVVTTLLDPFPTISPLSALIPFAGTYRPLYLGLGALAMDLLIAVTVTSLVRARLGYRSWRAVHWAAYAVFPVALVHGLGAGSDLHATWMQVLTLGCIAAVLAAVAARVAASRLPAGSRAGLAGGTVLAIAGIGAWAAQGPLATGWAARAGTPRSVLKAFSPPPRPIRAALASDPLWRHFSTPVAGRVAQGVAADGTAVVDVRLRLSSAPGGVMRLRLGGTPAGGGVSVSESAITLGPPTDPGRYSGRVATLDGGDLTAQLGAPDGRGLDLRLQLNLAGGQVTGQLDAAPLRPGARR